MAEGIVLSPLKNESNLAFSTKRNDGTNPIHTNITVKRKLAEASIVDYTLNKETEEEPTKRRKRRLFTVSIEGNIGSGKSTFLKYFSSMPGVETHEEPINLWKNVGGHNLLEMVYKDSKRWSFLFNSYVQLTRLNIHSAAVSKNSSAKLIERSLANNRFCFLENSRKVGNLNEAEFDTLSEYYNFLSTEMDTGIDLIVYLRTTPEVAAERIKKRGRPEESNLPLNYLKSLHESYENWLIGNKKSIAPVIIIDADKDLDSVFEEFEQHKLKILGKLEQKQIES